MDERLSLAYLPLRDIVHKRPPVAALRIRVTRRIDVPLFLEGVVERLGRVILLLSLLPSEGRMESQRL